MLCQHPAAISELHSKCQIREGHTHTKSAGFTGFIKLWKFLPQDSYFPLLIRESFVKMAYQICTVVCHVNFYEQYARHYTKLTSQKHFRYLVVDEGNCHGNPCTVLFRDRTLNRSTTVLKINRTEWCSVLLMRSPVFCCSFRPLCLPSWNQKSLLFVSTYDCFTRLPSFEKC